MSEDNTEKSLRDLQRKVDRRRKLAYINAVFIFTIITVSSVTLYEGVRSLRSVDEPNFEYNKSHIESNITRLISNGADLESVKHSYSTELDFKPKQNSIFRKNRDIKFSEIETKPTLEILLLNIKNDLLINIPKDSVLQKLNLIILENAQKNPFAKLEEGQRYFFTNIVAKLDTSYLLVQEDVLRISDELSKKNSIVVEYLSNSKGAFRNATIAMSISILSLLLVIILNVKKLSELIKKNGV